MRSSAPGSPTAGELDQSHAAGDGHRRLPQNPVVQQIGGRQQMRVVATYADGTAPRRDRRGVRRQRQHRRRHRRPVADWCTTLRRGEAPVLARYEGAYAATTLTVMGDRTGFAWTSARDLVGRSTSWWPPSGSG